MKQRIKNYTICKVDFSTMQQVQYKKPKEWVFLCKEYLVKIKIDNPFYTYGDIGNIKKRKNSTEYFF